MNQKKMSKNIDADEIEKICFRCGWNDYDYGCVCPSHGRWYQCELEPEPNWNEIIENGKLQ